MHINKKPASAAGFNLASIHQVAEPPKNFKRLLRLFNKKESITEANEPAYFVTVDDITECIRSWELDEDDFLQVNKNESFNAGSTTWAVQSPGKKNLNESFGLREKFSSMYQQLVEDLSDENDDNEEDGLNQILEAEEKYGLSKINGSFRNSSNKNDNMIINETVYNLSGEASKTEKTSPIGTNTTTKPLAIDYLNALFANDDEDEYEQDDDLKYIDKIPLVEANSLKSFSNSKEQNIYIDDTPTCSGNNLSKSDEKKFKFNLPANKQIGNLKVQAKREAVSAVANENITVISNSTSTPVRSILKNNNRKTADCTNGATKSASNLDTKISYSPLISPLNRSNTTPKSNKSVSFDENASLIGISQALALLQTPKIAKPSTDTTDASKTSRSEIFITFDMKHNLQDLFGN